MKNNREIGAAGEQIACDYLQKQGFTILKRNFYGKNGEIDIICTNETHIVFVEVKMRKATSRNFGCRRFGRPADAVNAVKRERLIATAREYLRENPCELSPRIDIMEIYSQELPCGGLAAEVKWFKQILR